MAVVMTGIAVWCAASIAAALFLGRVMAFARRRDPAEPAAVPRRRQTPTATGSTLTHRAGLRA